MGGEEPVGVGLAEAIATVRQELERAIEEGKDSALTFRAGAVELEVQVTFSRSGSAEAGVRAWVISAGTKGELSQSTVHTLKLTLTPVRRSDGADQMISDVAAR